jgi:hypothetical protein
MVGKKNCPPYFETLSQKNLQLILKNLGGLAFEKPWRFPNLGGLAPNHP